MPPSQWRGHPGVELVLAWGEPDEHQQPAAEHRDPEAVQCECAGHEVLDTLQNGPAEERIGQEHEPERQQYAYAVQEPDDVGDEPHDECDQQYTAKACPCQQATKCETYAVIGEREPVECIEQEQ